MIGMDFFVFLLVMILAIVLLFMMVWHLIMVDELKNDFRNPVDFCTNLNRLIIPEYGIHLIITVLLLLCGCWFTFMFNVPLLAYHIWRYMRRPPGMSGIGLYDPTEVMNRAQMSLYTKEGFVKIGFYVISFLVYLYKYSNMYKKKNSLGMRNGVGMVLHKGRKQT